MASDHIIIFIAPSTTGTERQRPPPQHPYFLLKYYCGQLGLQIQCLRPVLQGHLWSSAGLTKTSHLEAWSLWLGSSATISVPQCPGLWGTFGTRFPSIGGERQLASTSAAGKVPGIYLPVSKFCEAWVEQEDRTGQDGETWAEGGWEDSGWLGRGQVLLQIFKIMLL